jgi:hypothetical protein
MARSKSMPVFGAIEEVFHVKHFGVLQMREVFHVKHFRFLFSSTRHNETGRIHNLFPLLPFGEPLRSYTDSHG